VKAGDLVEECFTFHSSFLTLLSDEFLRRLGRGVSGEVWETKKKEKFYVVRSIALYNICDKQKKMARVEEDFVQHIKLVLLFMASFIIFV
jgi:hypothetical protein